VIIRIRACASASGLDMSPFVDFCDYTPGGNQDHRTSPMRILFIAPILAACSTTPGLEPSGSMSTFEPVTTMAVDVPDIDHVLLTQRTCALYVALRSHAWNEPIAFGRDLDDSMVHWNMCPGGTMVACVKAPDAQGDTIITGIPWPY
jgi:hypothetical protein